MDDFRRFFLRGLAALVPTLLTIAFLIWAYGLLRDHVGVHITEGLLQFCTWVRDRPAEGVVDAERDSLEYGRPIHEWDELGRQLTVEYKDITNKGLDPRNPPDVRNAGERRRDLALWRIAFAKYRLHLLGFLIAIVTVYFMGFFLASFIGRTAWRIVEGLLCRTPLIRAIYPNIKMVTDFLLSERSVEFSGVVAVRYPRKEIWSIGLSTGAPMRSVQAVADEDLVTIFIPSSPTPVTGYVIQVPKEDVLELNMTIDEALRFTISGGVIKPGALVTDTPAESEVE